MDELKIEILPLVELSQDEVILLQIAATGQSMMPIGRWKKPIESLVRKGLMHSYDKFNNVITPAGRQAIERDEERTEKLFEKIAQSVIATGKAQLEIKKCVTLAVEQLVRAVHLTQQLKGDAPQYALEQWAAVIFQEAEAKLNG